MVVSLRARPASPGRRIFRCFVHLSIHLSMYLPIYLYLIYLSIYLSICIYV